MKYYSKVVVDYSAKTVRTTIDKKLDLDGCITMRALKALGVGHDDELCFYADEETKQISISYTLTRLETPEETSKRISKEEAYNKRYDEYHAKRESSAQPKRG